MIWGVAKGHTSEENYYWFTKCKEIQKKVFLSPPISITFQLPPSLDLSSFKDVNFQLPT